MFGKPLDSGNLKAPAEPVEFDQATPVGAAYADEATTDDMLGKAEALAEGATDPLTNAEGEPENAAALAWMIGALGAGPDGGPEAIGRAFATTERPRMAAAEVSPYIMD
jgi:hypothetical protein